MKAVNKGKGVHKVPRRSHRKIGRVWGAKGWVLRVVNWRTQGPQPLGFQFLAALGDSAQGQAGSSGFNSSSSSI